MPDTFLHPPLPRHDGPHQSGIADPIWPPEPPAAIDPAKYKEHYAGQIERQNHLHAVFADVTVASRQELVAALKALSGFARHQMDKTPPPMRPLDPPPVNRRVSVTVGFGATLFTTIHGDDRFTLAGARPRSLKVMPAFAGDEGFTPGQQATDLVVLIASDDYYVNEYIFSRIYYGTVHPGIVARRVEHGYSRPDSREPSGFEDGVTNPKNLSSGNLLDQFVFVREGDPEPEWCVDGSYLAYRKIRRRMRDFFRMPMPEREAVFGVDRVSGLRHADAPANAHGPKMNPKRKTPDFMGVMDDRRHFLRRPYFFDDGVDAEGQEVRGVHHISFVRDLVVQYEWPVLLWQTNPDFPRKGTGMDALFARGGAATIGGGYYFMPPAPRSADDFIGSGMFR
jgi:deferrochelatase/peroxidase EfeB